MIGCMLNFDRRGRRGTSPVAKSEGRDQQGRPRRPSLCQCMTRWPVASLLQRIGDQRDRCARLGIRSIEGSSPRRVDTRPHRGARDDGAGQDPFRARPPSGDRAPHRRLHPRECAPLRDLFPQQLANALGISQSSVVRSRLGFKAIPTRCRSTRRVVRRITASSDLQRRRRRVAAPAAGLWLAQVRKPRNHPPDQSARCWMRAAEMTAARRCSSSAWARTTRMRVRIAPVAFRHPHRSITSTRRIMTASLSAAAASDVLVFPRRHAAGAVPPDFARATRQGGDHPHSSNALRRTTWPCAGLRARRARAHRTLLCHSAPAPAQRAIYIRSVQRWTASAAPGCRKNPERIQLLLEP